MTSSKNGDVKSPPRIGINATFKLEKESSEIINKSFIKSHASGKKLTEISVEIGELFAVFNALI